VSDAGVSPASESPAPKSERVPALLVMHDGLAEALLRAAAKVYGPVDEVLVLSNEGLSRAALEQRIVEAAGGWRHGGLVLTDFWGGSCHTSGLAAARACRGVAIITGVNLPLLLDYLHNRDQLDAVALADRLVLKGRDSIRVQLGPTA
jgi:mannose/fructose-specific phosphotransferase system component IIA